ICFCNRLIFSIGSLILPTYFLAASKAQSRCNLLEKVCVPHIQRSCVSDKRLYILFRLTEINSIKSFIQHMPQFRERTFYILRNKTGLQKPCPQMFLIHNTPPGEIKYIIIQIPSFYPAFPRSAE